MAQRKHISWKTRCAAALMELRKVPYDDAKQMTEDQFLSLFHFDHNILHETGHADRDSFWNLTPMFIAAHREKTKNDAAIIAKGRRIRDSAGAGNHVARIGQAPLRIDPDEAGGGNLWAPRIRPLSGSHKLKSRGFDKRFKRKIDGTVVKR